LRGDLRAVGLVTMIDALSGRTRHLRLTRDPACPACGTPSFTPSES
jgi:hypothetical protein